MVPSIEYSSPNGAVTSIVPVGTLQLGCVSVRAGAAGTAGAGSIVATVGDETQELSIARRTVTLYDPEVTDVKVVEAE